jgi:hypothetical protein
VVAVLVTGLTLLWIAMVGTVLLAPRIALAVSGEDHPDYAVIAGTGLVLILLSSAFLVLASQIAGLGAAWLGLAVVANGLVLAGKFVLAPFAVYETDALGGLVQGPAVPIFFSVVSGALFVLHAAVLCVLYAYQRVRTRRALGPAGPVREDRVAALTVLAAVVGIPLVVAASLVALGYYGLIVVAGTTGAALLVAMLAAAAGHLAMWRAADVSISIRDTAAVTSALWLGLSMLLVYHVVWVVLMAALVGIWPLKTIAVSGK